jgi:hypothetical protein
MAQNKNDLTIVIKKLPFRKPLLCKLDITSNNIHIIFAFCTIT